MAHATLKSRLAAGEVVRVMSLGALASPKLIEIVGAVSAASSDTRLDGFWIDQEHSGIAHREMEVLLTACRAAGLDAFVRVAPTDYATVMRPYEAGAAGVMAAQVRSVEQAKEIVEWSLYPPLGVRGLFMGNHEGAYGLRHQRDVVAQANRDRWLLIQIETAEAVECVTEIAALPGVDTLFIGPGDLASALGVPGESMHPKCLDAIKRAAEACKRAGKSWAVLSRTRDHADYCREHGCQLFSIVSDVGAVVSGLRSTVEEFTS